MKNIILVFAVAILLASCSSNVDLAIDNPTDQPVALMVDSLFVEVPAKEVVWVEMGKGNHTLTLANDSIIDFNFAKSVYMVNPTLSSYLMSEEFYGNPATLAGVSPIPNQKVTYFGMEFEGNYAVVDNVINEVKWDYGPRESVPEMIEIEAGDRAAVVKLMDPYEFIGQVMQQSGEAPSEN